MKQFVIFVKKEALHILRDPRTLVILIGMPVMQIILYGFALTNEVKNAKIAIYDQSKDEATRVISDEIAASRYFDLVKNVYAYAEIERTFRQGKIRLAVVFPQHFRTDLLHTNEAQVQLIADASDPNTANLLTNYATAIINDYQQTINNQQQLSYTIKTQVRMLYNPELKGAYNFVPGVMALVLMLVCAMMTSMAIVREKEMGNMEVLLVSPLKPFFMVLAKTVPYFLVSAINIGSILLLCVYVLNVPIRGSLSLLITESLLFTITSLSVGILISNHARTQQTAMFTSMMSLFLPTLLFSGFLFPIENMPYPLQLISNLVPAKWFFIIVKEVMIKGMGFDAVWKQTLILLIMTVVLLGISIRNFKIRLA
ncbi:multidrug ABC transporter permease [Niastella koreensis]|uniref:ABC-2 type transporter n=2 Tax=Niastella koreensis TaxID=354356 RepID=G8TJB0_NIAKG|nr:ABC transporter permease [Niastella koreensis]AEV98643.1 ABC-2 type transporter [Niastella koreensis GR20-10]OQP44420.1 multidrug ABC transporter permease [Niastella koreensis]